MNLHISKSKNAESFYICKSYVKASGSTSSMIVRKLGTLEQLLIEHGPTRDDVLAWAKNEVKIETEKYKKEKEEMGINSLPENLNDALNEFHADELVKEVLGKDFTKYYLKAKKEEWLEYMEQVSEWELEQYLYRV